MVVIDCCALIEMMTGSPEGQALRQLMVTDERILSVDLLRAETASVLRKLVISGKVAQRDAANYLESAMDLVDDFVSLESLQVEALREGIRLGQSTYDMFYFVLARRTGATLFTLDRKLIRLCEDNGVDCISEIALT